MTRYTRKNMLVKKSREQRNTSLRFNIYMSIKMTHLAIGRQWLATANNLSEKKT